MTAKISSLAKLPPRLATVTPLFPPQHVLILALLYLSFLFLLLLASPTPPWLDTRRITSSGFSGPFWILDLQHLFQSPSSLPPRTLKAHVSGLWKLDSQIFIGVKLTWSVTISSSCTKITLPPAMPRAQIEFRLRLPS